MEAVARAAQGANLSARAGGGSMWRSQPRSAGAAVPRVGSAPWIARAGSRGRREFASRGRRELKLPPASPAGRVRASTTVRASVASSSSSGSQGPNGDDKLEPTLGLGKKGRMAKMVDMSQSEGDEGLQGVQVFLVEFGLIAMGVVDTLMVGHVGESALAAACLGGTTTWLVMITAIGLLGALDPLLSLIHI